VTSNSPDHNAKGTQSPHAPRPKARRAKLLPLVGTRFQDLFHRPPGLLFTFPSRYWCTIGHEVVCSLGGWSPQLPTGFLGSRRTQVPTPHASPGFRLRDSHPLSWIVPDRFGYPARSCGTMPRVGPTTPETLGLRFGLLPFRSPLLRESHGQLALPWLISFPGAT
jgi:hypothetical protein